ncbi:hypothetical protein D3C80_659970 [compost metagenome]
MGCNFELFAEMERKLRDAFSQPVEDVLGLTKTERKKMAKAARRKPKALPIAVPDRTIIRLSCLPFSGPVVVLEFKYYTPFVEVAYQEALEEINKSGRRFKNIAILEKDRVEI